MTNKNPTQEQSKKVWKWCGQYTECGYCQGSGRSYSSPDAYSQCGACEGSGYFSPGAIDLNNLFKYAVPKLIKKYDVKIFAFYDDLNDKVFWVVHLLDGISREVEFANVEGEEDLKDALFWVIWEVVKK